MRTAILRSLITVTSIVLLLPSAKGDVKTDGDTALVVTLDRDAYRVHELYALEDLICAAASSRAERVYIGTADSAVDVVVRDLNQDPNLPNEIVEKMKHGGASVQKVPARSFWIDYSPSTLKTFGPERLQNDASRLEGFIDNLRTPLAGVVFTKDADGAIVRSNDPTFDSVLRRYLQPAFVISPLTDRSWRVSWDTTLWPKGWSAAKRLAAVANTPDALKQLLGDPLGLEVYSSAEGVNFIVRAPEQHHQFISAVENAFQKNSAFELRETPSLEILLSTSRPVSSRDSAPSGAELGLPPRENLRLMSEVSSLVSPPADIRIDGSAISVRAKSSAQNSELSAIVHGALSGHHDLIMTALGDGTLRVDFAPGAHFTPPPPVPSQSQLLEAVRSRLNLGRIEPSKIAPMDQSHLLVTFKSVADASSFRAMLSKSSGLTFRLVEGTSPKTGSIAVSPSPGDEMLKLPTGEMIWVKPEAIVTGNMLEDASVGESKYTSDAIVLFRLTDEGRERFEAMTRAHVEERFAIIVDGVALEAPVIQEPIFGGNGQIEGNFTRDTAQALVNSILPHRSDLPLVIDAAGSGTNNAHN